MGDLTVVPVADLGGLGAREGLPAHYDWAAPNPIVPLLPWLLVLGLLLLPPNRCGQAWWIWLPIACVFAGRLALAASSLPDEIVGGLDALGLGIAAVWLLAPYLARSHRFLSFLCYVPTLALTSLLVYLVRQGWEGAEAIQTVGVSLALAICGLIISVAMLLAGLQCRKHYRPGSLGLWLLVFIGAIWLLVAAPFFLLALLAGGGLPWSEFLLGWLVATGLCFGVLLPFLVLALANPLFRARLKALLHLERAAPPPALLPPIAAAPSPA
jgi:hypothetical protein